MTKSSGDEPVAQAGRPRDETLGPALMAAARRLVSRHGYGAVTIQMIAAEVGVGRQTLYRRWPGKAELVLDAFLESVGAIDIEEAGDVSVSTALKAYLARLFENLRKDGPAIRNLIASAQDDDAFLKTFRERFVKPRAEAVRRILDVARQRGEIAPSSDIDMLLALIHGGFWYPLLLGEPLNEAYADRLVDQLLAGSG